MAEHGKKWGPFIITKAKNHSQFDNYGAVKNGYTHFKRWSSITATVVHKSKELKVFSFQSGCSSNSAIHANAHL